MLTWLKKFWTDEAFFTAAVKSLVSLAGALVFSGIIPVTEWRYGAIVMALAHLIPGGQKDLGTVVSKLTDEQKRVVDANMASRAGSPDAVARPVLPKT